MLLNTVEGVRGVDEVLADTCRSYRIRGWLRMRTFVLRAASPQIIVGARQALSISIIMMVISELLGSTNGLGYTVVEFQRGFQIPEMWSGVFVLGLLGVLLSLAFTLVERRVLNWYHGVRAAERSGRCREFRCWRSVRCARRTRATAARSRHWATSRSTVEAGQFVCIVGPSGCGKTTLLRCLGGLLTPTSGEVKVGGVPVTGPPDGLAIVFQEYGRSLFPWLRVTENVELPLKSKGVGRSERRRLVTDALNAVGLSDAGKAYPWQLSGGMQQRVAIARAIAFQPRVMLMDEPFAAVDAQTRADLEDLVRRVWRQFGMTMLFVTHDIDESVYLGERVVMLSASPTHVMENLDIDLPDERDQLKTRSDARFVELRSHVYARIQEAKNAGGGRREATTP